MSLLSTASLLTLIVNAFAVIFNTLLLFVILTFSKRCMGFYKWLMVGFSLYELLYACAVLLVMPLHFVYQRSWIAFSYYGPLSRSEIATEATSLYCLLYAAWLGLVLVNFIYRYINLCKVKLAILISKRLWMKLGLLFCYLSFVMATAYCAYMVCRRSHPTEPFLDGLHQEYGLDRSEHLSYIMVQVHDPSTGDISLGGVAAVLIHMTFLIAWLAVIFFCGLKIWWKIREMQRLQSFINISLEKDLFTVLVLQTVIPLVFAGIPSLLHFTFPFWEHDAFFTPVSPFFSVVSSIPKALDPLVAMLCVRHYRDGIKKVMGIRSVSVSILSGSGAKDSERRRTSRHETV